MEHGVWLDFLALLDGNKNRHTDGAETGTTLYPASWFPSQEIFLGSNADLDSFFPATSRTLLGTSGLELGESLLRTRGDAGENGDGGMFDDPPQENQPPTILDPDSTAGSNVVGAKSSWPASRGSSSRCDGDPLAAEQSTRRPPRKKRARKQLTGEEKHARRGQVLERNRLAATKCRDRKKNWTQDIVAKLATQEQTHVHLHAGLVSLHAQLAALMEAACQHVGQCEQPDGFQPALAQVSERFAVLGRMYSGMAGMDFGNAEEQGTVRGRES